MMVQLIYKHVLGVYVWSFKRLPRSPPSQFLGLDPPPLFFRGLDLFFNIGKCVLIYLEEGLELPEKRHLHL